MVWPTCKCGCMTPLVPATHTNRQRGIVKGVAPHFLVGHGRCGVRTIPGAEQKCRRCGETRAIDAFEEYRPGLRRKVCRRCIQTSRADRLAASPELRRRARERQQRRDATAERERLRAYGRSLEGRAARARYMSANRDRVNARNRRYRAKGRARAREWGRANARRRRLRYDKDLCAWADVLVRDPCSYCGATSTGIDHIVAVSRGGSNAVENFTAACAKCNRRKRATPLLLFLAERL